MTAQHLHVVAVSGAPHRRQQLTVGDKAPAIDREHTQQVKLRWRQVHLLTIAAHDPRGEVELQAVGEDHGVLGLRGRAAQHRLQVT